MNKWFVLFSTKYYLNKLLTNTNEISVVIASVFVILYCHNLCSEFIADASYHLLLVLIIFYFNSDKAWVKVSSHLLDNAPIIHFVLTPKTQIHTTATLCRMQALSI